MHRCLFIRALFVCLALAALARPAGAQVQYGNLYGTVIAEDGTPAPGATVTLADPQGPPMVHVTDAQGRFRFLGLRPGKYTITAAATATGAATATTVRISAGRNSEYDVTVHPVAAAAGAPPEATATIQPAKAQSGPATTVTAEELEKIPTSRDPWAVLNSVPGVLTDRISVGGSENGQTFTMAGPGAPPDQTQWTIDGANITDAAALGSPPAYYDFDSFEEMQVTTGVADVTQATSGTAINIVTKRGTNEWRGSGRYYLGSAADPSDPLETALDGAVDFGADLSGPVVRDRIWFFGSYGRQSIDLQSRGLDAPFDRDVNRGTITVNLNGKAGPNNRPTLTFLRTDRLNGGVSQNPIRAATSFDEESSPTFLKIEDTHVFSSNFYLSGLFSAFNGGFTASPRSSQQPLFGGDEIERGYFHYDAERDSREFRLEGESFFNRGSIGHTLKFGAGYRESSAVDRAGWTNDILLLPLDGQSLFFRTPEATRASDLSYASAYIQDTIETDNLTFNLGVRYDSQGGSVAPSSMRFPFNTSVPPLSFDGGGEIDWDTLTPRLGLTYALRDSSRTLLRLSYARFPSMLTAQKVNLLNPIEPLSPSGAEAYQFLDANNNQSFDPDEPRVFLGFPTFAPNDSRLLDVPNEVDKNLKTPVTDELLFGIEHALLPDLSIGATVSYRSFGNLMSTVPIVEDSAGTRPATASDYEVGEKLSGTFNLPAFGSGSYSTDVFTLKPNVAPTGGVLLTNSDRGQRYTGATFAFDKRLANRWMLRGHVTFSDWSWSDPPDPSQHDADVASPAEAGVVAPAASVTGRDGIFLNSRWSFAVNGLYQVAPDQPWNFDLGWNLYSRQGFPAPLFRVVDGERVPLLSLDEFRYDSPALFDLQASKSVQVGRSEVRFSVGVFNLLNARPVLQRDLNIDHSTAGRVLDLGQGRAVRLGARFTFR